MAAAVLVSGLFCILWVTGPGGCLAALLYVTFAQVPLLEVRGMMALPAGWELAAAIIVLHSLIELGAMTAYLWWVPTRLVPFDSLG